MIGAVPLAMSAPATSALPAPVIVVDDQTQTMPVPAISWTCNAATAEGKKIVLGGDFPALTSDELKKAAGNHLRANMRGSENDHFTGTFPAALTFNLAGMTNYSVLVGQIQSGSPAYILKFEFTQGKGFVNVLDVAREVPLPYATGLCTSQAKS